MKPTEGKRRRANSEEKAQRKQQKRDIRKQKQQARLVLSYTQAPEATKNNEPRRAA